MSTSAAMTGQEEAPSHRPAIQGLRAVAVLMVVAYHAGLPAPGGFTGVDVFFVISGFVIAEMLRREWTATGTIALREFFRRRVRRLLPALALVIVVTLVLNALIVAPLEQPVRTALTGLGGLLVGANVVIGLTSFGYFDAPAATNPLLHLWSLSVEEQFYLVLPVILLVTWRSGRRRGWTGPLPAILVVGAVSAAALAFAPLIIEATGLPSLAFGFYSPIVRTWEFLVGVLLALTVRWRHVGGRTRQVAGVLGIALLVVATFGIDGTDPFPGLATLLPVVGAALLIVATEARQGRLHDGLAARPMVWIGDRSYAWYLWHWPLIVFASVLASDRSWAAVAVVVAAGASLLPSWWSYRSVEQPLRMRRDAPLRPLIIRALVVPVVISGFMTVGASNAWFVPALADAEVQVNTRSIAQQAGCHKLFDEFGEGRFDDCWFGPATLASPIFLLGDSNAATAADPVVAAGEAVGRPVFVSTGPSCPPFLGVESPLPDGCRQLVEATFRWLATQPSGDVVLVATDGTWFPDGEAVADVEAYARALRRTVAAVKDAGHDPVVVTPIPAFVGLEDGVSTDKWRLSSCTLVGFFRDACGERFVITPTWPQRPLWDASAEVAAEFGGGLVDLAPHLCPNDVCRTDRDGSWNYRDGIHLSARRSLTLAPVYREALEP